jgi:hypothetical protein
MYRAIMIVVSVLDFINAALSTVAYKASVSAMGAEDKAVSLAVRKIDDAVDAADDAVRLAELAVARAKSKAQDAAAEAKAKFDALYDKHGYIL